MKVSQVLVVAMLLLGVAFSLRTKATLENTSLDSEVEANRSTSQCIKAGTTVMNSYSAAYGCCSRKYDIIRASGKKTYKCK